MFKSLFLFSCFGLVSCATYQSKVHDARNFLSDRHPIQAIERLQPLAQAEGRDQLIYLLDLATAQHEAGQYKESAVTFANAERLAELQDYHSISRIAGSLALSEEMQQYKGENYEKVMMNVINSLNFLAMNDLEGALVEVRRVNQKLHKLKNEGKKYELNPFAYYMSGIIWEADRKYDDAYIAYKHAFELMPDFAPLQEDLVRLAIKAQRPDELEKWQKQFKNVALSPDWKNSSLGELIVIYQQGWGPRKTARPDNHRFPMLVPYGAVRGQIAKVEVGRMDTEQVLAERVTSTIFSIEETAIRTFEDDMGRLIASRMAGIATKAVLADQLRQKDEALGGIAWILMNVADRADLRQWSTLPATLQVARIRLSPGQYRVKISAVDSDETAALNEIKILPGKKAFLSWRSFR